MSGERVERPRVLRTPRTRRAELLRLAEEVDAAAPAFVPVQVVPDEAGAGAVTVVLAGGRTVRVSPGFDAATLRRVVAMLEEGAPY